MKTGREKYDVVAIGEALIDFTEYGISENGQRLFEQNPGGAPANVVSALSRFGLSTAFIGKVGNDMHGRYLLETLSGIGVDVGGMLSDSAVFTTLAFVGLNGGERSFSFARKPGADTYLSAEEIDFGILQNTSILHFGSLSLTASPSREAAIKAVETAKNSGALISFDPNYRAQLWGSKDEAYRQVCSVLPFVDMIKLSDDEAELITGSADPALAVRLLNETGIKIAAVTLGKKGALVSVGSAHVYVPGYDTQPLDTTGAGDAFWAGFLYSYLSLGKSVCDISIEEAKKMAMFGNAAAAICVSRRGGIPAMPSLEEVTCFSRTHL